MSVAISTVLRSGTDPAKIISLATEIHGGRPVVALRKIKLTESKPRTAVLLVEDEALIRMMIAGMIEELGHTVVAEAANIEEALKLAKTADFGIAVLDINVGGDRIEPVAEIINDRRLPFVFASGYGAAGMPEKFRDRPILQKPFVMDRLGEAIQKALEVAEGSKG
jgi:CheY-like chemotaxis protein